MTNPRFFRKAMTGQLPKQALSASQLQLLAVPASGIATIFGSPGSGKSTVLKAKYLELLATGLLTSEILVIAANRESANTLRDEMALELQGATEGPIAKTLASVAFSILQERSVLLGLRKPELISGGSQDKLLAKLITESLEDLDSLWPKQINAQVMKLSGFRSELRDLLSVALEHGSDAAHLKDLGIKHQMPTWIAASKIFEKYLVELETSDSEGFDSASLLRKAAEYLLETTTWPKNVEGLKHILVDDAQELTPAEAFLISVISNKGAGLSLIGDPDVSTLGFRAANPKAMTLLAEKISMARQDAVTTIFLEPTHAVRRPEISSVLARVSSQIESARAGRQRKGLLPQSNLLSEKGFQAIETRIFNQTTDEVSALARSLRERHLYDLVPWHEMAVVARSRDQLETLSLQLAAESVPVRVIGQSVALRDEYASKELLEIARICCSVETVDTETAKRLLTSSYCGLDQLGLLRLKRQLRSQSESDKSGDELLAELFLNESSVVTIKSLEGKKVDKFLKLFLGAKKLTLGEGFTAEALLWELFNGGQLASKWQTLSRGVSEIAVQANRNLDAILTVFAAASRFTERNPNRNPLEFIEDQLALGLPEDTLALNDFVDNRVALLTPSALIGKRFNTLALPGLIEGVWPNLKPRSSLLGAATLDGLLQGNLESVSQTLKSELPDELRMLNKAIGATSEKLLVSATDKEEEQISQFVSLINGFVPEAQSKPQSQLTLRGLAGSTRRALAMEKDANQAKVLALALARLAVANVPGANPDSWYGMNPLSTTEPLTDFDAEEKVTIRPSQLDSYLKCPLHWFISSHGGSDSSFSANLGTLIHEVLEVSESGSEKELTSLVDSRWNTLEFEADWLEEAGRRKASKMISNLSSYLQDFADRGGKAVGREEFFSFELPKTRIRGLVDRIELLPEGTVVIVDLKTTASTPTEKEVLTNPQLALYQMAFTEKAFEHLEDLPENSVLGGAKLLIIGGDKTIEKNQPAFDVETSGRFKKLLDEASEGMSKTVFVAQVSSHCQDKRQYGSCELHLTRAVSYVG
jgi:superfamily I DNA/RNA helicase/RecB family exonuclease